MQISYATLIIMLCCLNMGSPQAFGQPAHVSAGQAQDSEAAKYWDSIEKQRKLNQCLKLGRGECYRKYQEAVDWCLKNWNECLPMIKHSGVYAGSYGQRVAEQCRRELEAKCREEAGQ